MKTAGTDASTPAVSVVRDVFQRAIDENLGALNMTAVVKLLDEKDRTFRSPRMDRSVDVTALLA